MEDADPLNRPCIVVGSKQNPCRQNILTGDLDRIRHDYF